jgi:hypothetical protein
MINNRLCRKLSILTISTFCNQALYSLYQQFIVVAVNQRTPLLPLYHDHATARISGRYLSQRNLVGFDRNPQTLIEA